MGGAAHRATGHIGLRDQRITQGSIASRAFNFPANGVFTETDQKRTAVVALGMSVLAAIALLGGWFAFVRLTRMIVVALADAADGAGETAAAWLISDDDSEAKTRTVASEVALYLGAAWAVVIVTPGVLGVVQAFA